MNLNKYQKKVRETAIYPWADKINDANIAVYYYPLLALGEEVGELHSIFAKCARDSKGSMSEIDRQKAKGELGDIFWNIANLSAQLGFELEEIADFNLYKLKKRKIKGLLSGSGDNR